MKKKIIIISVVLGLAALITFRLSANKTEMNEKAKLGMVTSKAIPVEMEEVKLLKVGNDYNVIGTFNAISDLELVSETQGRVIQVYKKKGMTVRKGDLLAKVESDLAQADLMAAQAQFDKMKADAVRFEKLNATEAVTSRQLEEAKLGLKSAEAQLKTAQKRLENTSIKAPVGGIINEDFIQEGTYTSPGMKLYEIVDVTRLNIDASLPESQIINIEVGQNVMVLADIYSGVEFKGKVTAISAKADASMKYGVQIEIENKKDNPLKAGMYGTAQFKSNNNNEILSLSRESIVGGLKDPHVYVIVDGKASLKKIVIGRVINGNVEIMDGLKSGDMVVGKGQINLKEGTSVVVR